MDSYGYAYSGLLGTYLVIELIIAVIMIVSWWKLFEKAGKPGWASIIPFYNIYIMLEIAGLQWWWLLIIIFLPFIPIIGLIVEIGVWFYVNLKFVQSYGKDTGFAIGAFFLPFIFYPIMAFNKDINYVGPAGQGEVDQILNQMKSNPDQNQQEQQSTENPQDTQNQ